MPRHCLTLDLKDDAKAIAEYKRYHVKIWPEVKKSLFDAGVLEMEIYLLGTRMFMIMDVDDQRMPRMPRCRSGRRSWAASNSLCPKRGPGRGGWSWNASSVWRNSRER